MGYVDKTLGRDETARYRAHYSWAYSLLPTFWFSLGAATVAMYWYLQFREGIPYSDLHGGWIFAAIACAAGSLRLLTHVINLWTTEFVVTTYRFVFKNGWVRRHTQEVSLNKIEEITLNQSILGRILGFGRITLHGTGVGVIVMPWIAEPLHFRREIEEARADLRRSDQDERRGDND